MSEQAKRVANYGDRSASAVSYWKRSESGEWYIHWPEGLLGGLANHSVTEHDDGTITVTPSILTTGTDQNGAPLQRHGFLTKGIWEEC